MTCVNLQMKESDNLVTKYKVGFIEFAAIVAAEEWLMLVPCYAKNEEGLFPFSKIKIF